MSLIFSSVGTNIRLKWVDIQFGWKWITWLMPMKIAFQSMSLFSIHSTMLNSSAMFPIILFFFSIPSASSIILLASGAHQCTSHVQIKPQMLRSIYLLMVVRFILYPLDEIVKNRFTIWKERIHIRMMPLYM